MRAWVGQAGAARGSGAGNGPSGGAAAGGDLGARGELQVGQRGASAFVEAIAAAARGGGVARCGGWALWAWVSREASGGVGVAGPEASGRTWGGPGVGGGPHGRDGLPAAGGGLGPRADARGSDFERRWCCGWWWRWRGGALEAVLHARGVVAMLASGRTGLGRAGMRSEEDDQNVASGSSGA
nr:uncharacterized protein LOC127319599 [Lolium perenne]